MVEAKESKSDQWTSLVEMNNWFGYSYVEQYFQMLTIEWNAKRNAAGDPCTNRY